MHTLTISRENIDGDDNNRFVYNLPGSKNLEGAEIALVDLFMYYSWQNLNSQPLQNNTLSMMVGTEAPNHPLHQMPQLPARLAKTA